MKLLVTGGLGFIGANFVFYWLRKYPNDQIVILDKKTYAVNPQTERDIIHEFGSKVSIMEGDICDSTIVDTAVSQVDTIVHFAAESHVDRSVTHPEAFLVSNVLGTYTLLHSALKHDKKRFHHISTDEVFGSLELGDREKFTLNTKYDPRSPYSASKASSDHVVRAFFHTYGLPVTISNCANNYGPYNFPEKIIPLFITRLMQNKSVPIYSDGLSERDYLHVDDHARAIDMILKKGTVGETYLVGSDREWNANQLGEILCNQLGVSADLLKHTIDRPGHDRRYAIDSSETTARIGWKQEISFEDGIAQTIEWYKNRRDWWEPIAKISEQVAEKYLNQTIH